MSFVPCPDNYLKLGYISWVRMEDEGTAQIRVCDLFLKAAEGFMQLELSMIGEYLVQASPARSRHLRTFHRTTSCAR